LTLVGITGTNGKTTTSYLVDALLRSQGLATGIIGTIQYVLGDERRPAGQTTPDALELQAMLALMRAGGVRGVAMEVSSHALELGRVAGIRFACRVFTNLTQDHLDFHSDMEDYFVAKRVLFFSSDEADASSSGVAVVNADDRYGQRLIDELRGQHAAVVTFSAAGAGEADFRATEVEFDAAGARFRCLAPDGEARVAMPLPGHFNVENALAALACAAALGIGIERGTAALSATRRVPGRFEPVEEGQPFTVLVDYAHTPDSLDNVLRAARRITEGRLICVFGCGGDRDREKRPLMGRIGAELSDVCVVTSDNPRSEDPTAIIAEILAGMPKGATAEPDRRAAIGLALDAARPGDTVVIAGKGHEQGQEFEGGRKIPFVDRQVAGEELRRLRAPSK
ncbi:MAG: UDP-N-acetylmuramoyl-L-alanyl-D-glutamate--2,6-diaminopimelate ligase, partial [Solirubrobacterales bacterium]